MTDKYGDTAPPNKKPKLKTLRFHLNIGEADRSRLLKKAEELLVERSQVKVVLQLRGREKAHPEKGVEFLNTIAQELNTVGSTANHPTTKNLFITFNPKKRS